MDLKTLRVQAREKMSGVCRVCKKCDGRTCAGELPGMGGIGSGLAFQENIRALEEIKFKSRLIHDVHEPETRTDILELPLDMPVIIAPLAGTKFNMGNAISEERFANIVVGSAISAGITACTGDGTEEAFDSGMKAIERASGNAIPVVKPWIGSILDQRLERCLKSGCKIIGMDIDAATNAALNKGKRTVGPKTYAELVSIVDKIHAAGLKFMLKGILSAEDAKLAKEAGCDAIVVSNHGGRIFESAPATASALPAIAAIAGHMTVLVDGGIRSGADVLKMIALGANAVLLGRPVIVAAIGGEEEGVSIILKRLRRQLMESMVLTGCKNIGSVGKEILA